MVKINASTIESTIDLYLMKLKRKKFNERDAWQALKAISYSNKRIKAVLSYGGYANFNTQEESTTGDLFAYIDSYAKHILRAHERIKVSVKAEGKYVRKFSPQDIAVILENLISNSEKHKAEHLYINMFRGVDRYHIHISDDGRGIDREKVTDIDELFEFGNSYTETGSGVGLYHVKDIVENRMNGTVKINEDKKNGFEVQMRF